MADSKSFLSVLSAGLAPRPKALTSIDGTGGSRGWMGLLTEPFAGAWQRHITVDSPRDVLAFSAVFSCVTIIASDIGKLEICLDSEDEDGIFTTVVKTSPYWAVLRKPNHFQNRIEFIKQWIVSKLLWGNAYVLKSRDARGVVNGLYVLDPQRVTPLVADSGDVYYRLGRDDLSGVKESWEREKMPVFPASEIIHDKMTCLWHPLVGVSPIYACGMSATMGNRIQKNSTRFFDNMSTPSGLLTSEQKIDDELAGRMKRDWEEKYSGNNVGRVAVLGSGLKYEKMSVPANDAQLIEQLKWTVEDVARCFKMPLYKIGGVQNGSSLSALNQGYYNDCLQELIESLELCLKEGLELPVTYFPNVDEEGLLRMDQGARFKAHTDAITGGWLKPNEARRKENLAPVSGGDTPYMQQQNYSLAALEKRDATPDPFRTAPPPAPRAAPPKPEDDDGATLALVAEIFTKGLEEDLAA